MHVVSKSDNAVIRARARAGNSARSNRRKCHDRESSVSSHSSCVLREPSFGLAPELKSKQVAELLHLKGSDSLDSSSKSLAVCAGELSLRSGRSQ